MSIETENMSIVSHVMMAIAIGRMRFNLSSCCHLKRCNVASGKCYDDNNHQITHAKVQGGSKSTNDLLAILLLAN
jgi:hypothetical protein